MADFERLVDIALKKILPGILLVLFALTYLGILLFGESDPPKLLEITVTSLIGYCIGQKLS